MVERGGSRVAGWRDWAFFGGIWAGWRDWPKNWAGLRDRGKSGIGISSKNRAGWRDWPIILAGLRDLEEQRDRDSEKCLGGIRDSYYILNGMRDVPPHFPIFLQLPIAIGSDNILRKMFVPGEKYLINISALSSRHQ